MWAAAVVGAPITALADVKHQGGYVWEANDKRCLWDHAELSHGSGGGYAQSTPRAVQETSTPAGDVECWQDWPRPPYYLAASNKLAKWYAGAWYLCVDGRWKLNGAYTDQITKTSVYRTPCGRGYYANFGGGATYFNGKWRGGFMYSGYHALPAN